MRVTLLVPTDGDGHERRTYDRIREAETHGYGTTGVRLTHADGESEIVEGASIAKAVAAPDDRSD